MINIIRLIHSILQYNMTLIFSFFVDWSDLLYLKNIYIRACVHIIIIQENFWKHNRHFRSVYIRIIRAPLPIPYFIIFYRVPVSVYLYFNISCKNSLKTNCSTLSIWCLLYQKIWLIFFSVLIIFHLVFFHYFFSLSDLLIK